MAKYRNYTNEDVEAAVKISKSIAGVLKTLGLKPVGGNYANMRRKIQALELDTSHFTGQLWSKGERLKDWSSYTRVTRIKVHLLQIRGNRCESCGLTEWLGNPIKLEVHHVDRKSVV